MAEFDIEQGVILQSGSEAYELQARSPGFPDAWLPRAEELCRGFGRRPSGVRCPACVFAAPFDKRSVAVVQVADQAEPIDTLGFRLLVLSTDLYAWIGDPFHIAERFALEWDA